MSKRNDTIEIYAIKAFCEKFNASVIKRPNPPEAIIEYRDNANKTWLEVTTLWEDCGQKKLGTFRRQIGQVRRFLIWPFIAQRVIFFNLLHEIQHFFSSSKIHNNSILSIDIFNTLQVVIFMLKSRSRKSF